MVLNNESRIAVVESRVDTLSVQVNQLIPLVTSVSRVEGHVEGLRRDLTALGKEFHDDRDTASDERKGVRNALFIMSGTLGAAVITGAALIISAGG